MTKIQNIFFVQKTPPTTNGSEKESTVVDKMTKAALSSLDMAFGIALKKILARFNEVMEKRKRKRTALIMASRSSWEGCSVSGASMMVLMMSTNCKFPVYRLMNAVPYLFYLPACPGARYRGLESIPVARRV
jgi:hypothetical protein